MSSHRNPHNPDKPSSTHTRIVQVSGRHVVVRVIDGDGREYEPVRHQSATLGSGGWSERFSEELRERAIQKAKLRVEREGLT